MIDSIICFIVSFACGALFYGIGDYAKKLKTPMHFWSGSKVQTLEIKDVKNYNKENCIMWKLYSLSYFIAGILGFLNLIFFAIILTLNCTIGLFLLILSYKKIYKKYQIK